MTESPTLWGVAFGVAAWLAGKIAEALFKVATSRGAAREERRTNALNQLEKVVLEARDQAVRYWADSGNAPDQKQREASVQARLQFALDLIIELFEGSSFYSAVDLEWQRLHEACTFGDFGSVRRIATPERANDIEISAYSLIHKATTCRSKLSKPLFH